MKYAYLSVAAMGLMLGLTLAGHAQNTVLSPKDLAGQVVPTNGVWVETLDLSKMTEGYGTAAAGRSIDGHPLTLGGTVYPHGIGTHAVSEFVINLHGSATRFTAMVGVDDETHTRGSVAFSVSVDGKTLARTGVLHGGDTPQLVSVDLTGARRMILRVSDGGDGIAYDHADWAGAVLTLAPGAAARPEAFTVPLVPARLTFPAPDPKPAIHGPRVVGVTPGHPFLFSSPQPAWGRSSTARKVCPPG